MREVEFREWLRSDGKAASTINTQLSKARKLDRAFGDLDRLHAEDRLVAVAEELSRKPPSERVLSLGNEAERNHLRMTVRYYQRFLNETATENGWPALEQLRAKFLKRIANFQNFADTENNYQEIERKYKDAMILDVRKIVASGGAAEDVGRRIYKALMPQQGPLLRWQTADAIEKKTPDLVEEFYSIIGELARSAGPVEDRIIKAANRLRELKERGATVLTPGQTTSVAITVAGMADPSVAAPFKTTIANKAAQLLTGRKIFDQNFLTRPQIDAWLDLLRNIRSTMEQRWRWKPRDLVDVQGFLWVALDENWSSEDEELSDAAILARFSSRSAFSAILGTWDDETKVAFCRVARAAHQVGLDWWHTDIQPYQLRFGRKQPQRARADAVFGYVGGKTPAIWFNDGAPSMPNDSAGTIDAVISSRFEEALAAAEEYIRNWKAGDDIRPGLWPDELSTEEAGAEMKNAIEPPHTTNLILYGPPGTGKTFATAQEAVRLCGEEVPDDREQLMAAYRRLVEAGRIEFLTFHQNYAYEEFVEGLRPVQQEEDSAGFHLQPEPGVLRRMARRAATSTGSGGPEFAIGDRQIFKMSIGRANDPEDAYLFEEAIEGGYALIGFDNLDWSDPRFETRSEIIAKLETEGNREGEISPYSGRVQSPDIFRNWVRNGDLIVVSKGNLLFRAIGEVTGDYEYSPRSDGTYSHRRGVKWLWVDRAGVPVEEISSTKFSQKTIYLLTKSDLNLPALERYIESQREGSGGEPDQFVLIIDEINRANVSKVMGELITLLEPDKRIGATNELRVRLPYSREIFGLPSNLHIVGTMNTADRSIALLDTALRRRFKFKEVPPRPQLLDEAEAATGLPLVKFLNTINDRIEYLLDREHRIGHAYFINCRKRNEVDSVMHSAVIPLLQEYFFEDLSRVAVVLGESKKGGAFLSYREIKDPLGEDDARPSWTVLSDFAVDAYDRCINAPTTLLVEPMAEAAE